MGRVGFWVRAAPRSPVLWNTVFLTLSTLVGSALGLVFWVVVARNYTLPEVGLGAAYLSAAVLVAAIADLGFGVTVIRFLPALGHQRATFLNAALTVVTFTSVAGSLIFAAGIPVWSPELREVASGLPLIVFVATIALLTLNQLLDRVFVAFEAAHLMFVRTTSAHLIRIAIVAALAGTLGSLGILVPVLVAATVTFAASAFLLAPHAMSGSRPYPTLSWRILRSKLRYTISNHASVMLWNAPTLLYPLIVVGLLGAEANARFYVSWMIANLLLVLPSAGATAAFTRASNIGGQPDQHVFWQSAIRVLIVLILPAGAVIVFAPTVLGLFGSRYTENVVGVFALLVLSAFPYTLNTAAITFRRMSTNAEGVLWLPAAITFMCLALSVALADTLGLVGVAGGWLAGQLAGVGLSVLTMRRRRDGGAR